MPFNGSGLVSGGESQLLDKTRAPSNNLALALALPLPPDQASRSWSTCPPEARAPWLWSSASRVLLALISLISTTPNAQRPTPNAQ